MPISVVVGAQYGSEGKGKVSYEIAKLRGARASVRVGGPNSGHTVVEPGLAPVIFRQLPTSALLPGVMSILPPGSYIDLPVLLDEIQRVGATPHSLAIDPNAVMITEDNKRRERDGGLITGIGSTASGTGDAVRARVMRDGSSVRASAVSELQLYLADTLTLQRGLLDDGQRIVIEGTQGFGLSPLHGGHGDFATSRDTTASSFVGEAGMSPLDIDEVVLVARAYPIRVAGNSGPLARETSWDEVATRSSRESLVEYTTVTHRVRRVGEFDPEVVVRAIAANKPSLIVMNHLDYVADLSSERGRKRAQDFLLDVESAIGREIDFAGISREALKSRHETFGLIR